MAVCCALSAMLGLAGMASTAAAQTVDFSIVTWNVGTLAELPHDDDLLDGYTSYHAAISDDHYGNGLAWSPAIAAATQFFADNSPEVVAFQEIFDPNLCYRVPAYALPNFVCESWQPGDPTVVEIVLGPGYQIACHIGKSDKCLAVRTDFGSIEGCSQALCFDGLDGASIGGCGSGSRVARGRIQLTSGGVLTLAHVHGTSGIGADDKECREQQFDQLFLNMDGTPAADGALNIVLGDFNTDPVRLIVFDSSAQRLTSYAGPSLSFDFLSDSGPNDPPSYIDFVTIDHVISDSVAADCEVHGLVPGSPQVLGLTYFDHKPIICLPEPTGSAGLAAGLLGLACGARRRGSRAAGCAAADHRS